MPTQKRSPASRARPAGEKASGGGAAAKPKPDARRAQPQSRPAAVTTPLMEWIAAGVGLVLALGALAVIGRDALSPAAAPPAVKVEVLEILPAPTGYLARIRAVNVGDEPAAGVEVEGELTAPGRAPQTARATFDYLAAGSSQEGGLFFQTDPRAGALTVAAKGYVDP